MDSVDVEVRITIQLGYLIIFIILIIKWTKSQDSVVGLFNNFKRIDRTPWLV